MDELLGCLNSFNVAGSSNSIHAEHPRFSQYKLKESKSSQEARRKAILLARKQARYDIVKHIRQVDEPSEITEEYDGSMDYEEAAECYRKPKEYKDFLMLSEWLVDIPEDFNTNYVALPVPVGKRCLVVSKNGRSTMYGRNGKKLEVFTSLLPGGSRQTVKGNAHSMIDCIVSYTDDTFYVIDIITWVNQAFIQVETKYRLDWLKSRFSEYEHNLNEVSTLNDYKFKVVPHWPCDKTSLERMMSEPLDFALELDGVMFLHREGHYTHGATPLVGWLRPYMFGEILGVSVGEHYMNKKPSLYTNLPMFIEHNKKVRQEKLERDQITKREAAIARKERRELEKGTKEKMEVEIADKSQCP